MVLSPQIIFLTGIISIIEFVMKLSSHAGVGSHVTCGILENPEEVKG